MDNSQHFREIDICKGILAILVVMGHVLLQTEMDNPVLHKLNQQIGLIIYSFHMHLFFLIAGFLSIKILNFNSLEEKVDFLKKRAKRLLIPYFFMGFLYLPFKVLMSTFSRTQYSFGDLWKIFIGTNPDGALWFLYSLFIITLIMTFLLTKRNLTYVFFITLIMYLLSFCISVNISLFSHILIYSFFFTLGIYIRTNYVKFNNYFLKSSLIILYVFVFLWLTILYINTVMPSMIIRMLLAFFGSLMLLNLSCIFSIYFTKFTDVLITLGVYSMDIYMFSEPVKVIVRTICKLLNLNSVVTVAACIFFAIIVPILVSKSLLEKNKTLKLLFLGK